MSEFMKKHGFYIEPIIDRREHLNIFRKRNAQKFNMKLVA